MNFKTLILGAALALGTAFSAYAQTPTILDGNSVDDITNIAKGYGSASLETQSNGAPKVSGRINGVTYTVYFMNCSDAGKDCEDLNFYSGFADNKPTMDLINAWNRDKRFGKAYLDSDLDAVVEFDLNLEHGVTRDNVDAAFELWSLILDQYTTYIGYK
jgi:Putative bacterial sensory transduction regulator